MSEKKKILSDTLSGISRVQSLRDVGLSLIAILGAFIVGGILVALSGESAFEVFQALWKGSFGSVNSLATTLSKAIPLIFTGLGVAVAYRCGLFNIGAEGQLHIGAMVATLIAIWLTGLPKILMLPVVILSGGAAGMAWGGAAGFLKAKFGTHEVIVTIMLNYIAIFFTSYLANGPFKAEGPVSQTEIVPEAAQLAAIVPKTQLSTGLFLAILVSYLVYVFLWKTPWGFEIRAVGENPTSAEAGGISIYKNTIFAMALSGGIASLAGVTEVLGVYGRFIEGFSPEFGFTGIAVAILGRNHPVGVILSAVLFGALSAGALQMDRVTDVSGSMVVIIQGLVILFVAAPELFGGWLKGRGK